VWWLLGQNNFFLFLVQFNIFMIFENQFYGWLTSANDHGQLTKVAPENPFFRGGFRTVTRKYLIFTIDGTVVVLKTASESRFWPFVKVFRGLVKFGPVFKFPFLFFSRIAVVS